MQLPPPLLLLLLLLPMHAVATMHAPMELWLQGHAQARPAISAADGWDRCLVAQNALSAPGDVEVAMEATSEGVRSLIDACSRAPRGAAVHVRGPSDQRAALALVGSVEWLLLSFDSKSQAMITCENLLAACADTPTRVAACVTRADDCNGLAFALDLGVDALVVSESALEDDLPLLEAAQVAKAQRLERVQDEAGIESGGANAELDGRGPVRLEAAEVVDVADGGRADRVCLDLTCLLSGDEGCLVGSSAKALLLLHGETVASGFVPPRPFRLNAGPVHAYCLLADGSTKYLSELNAGDRLRIVALDGRCRDGVIGRCKVEPRPVLRVSWKRAAAGAAAKGEAVEEEEAVHQTFLQQAETVRLAGADERPIPVTSLRPGHKLLGRWVVQGTHVGRPIRAQVEER